MDMQLGCTALLVGACKRHGLLRNQAAYVLATALHETAHTMKPVKEYGGERYLKSKPYYPYVGRGFVQLTWKVNYEKAGKELGVDFVNNPDKLLNPDYSAAIIVVGMRDGWFTGKKLSDYIDLQHSDFVNARRIVNGTDRASLIAGYARDYDDALKAMGYGDEPLDVDHSPSPDPEPSKPDTSAISTLVQALVSILKAIFGAKK